MEPLQLLSKMDWEALRTVAQLIAFAAGTVWAIFKIKEFRELKHLIQLDISANIYKLSTPIKATAYSWGKEGNREERKDQIHTHAVEVLLLFRNRGKTRLKIFNIQVALNTMRPFDKIEFNKDTGQPKMRRIFTSGNVVPPMKVDGKPVDETSFYYIEPATDQVIDYVALIPEPNELLQVIGLFSLEQVRLFPQKFKGRMRLYPHSVARTYQIDSAGNLSDNKTQHSP